MSYREVPWNGLGVVPFQNMGVQAKGQSNAQKTSGALPGSTAEAQAPRQQTSTLGVTGSTKPYVNAPLPDSGTKSSYGITRGVVKGALVTAAHTVAPLHPISMAIPAYEVAKAVAQQAETTRTAKTTPGSYEATPSTPPPLLPTDGPPRYQPDGPSPLAVAAVAAGTILFLYAIFA